jgi:hypothetical protein
MWTVGDSLEEGSIRGSGALVIAKVSLLHGELAPRSGRNVDPHVMHDPT